MVLQDDPASMVHEERSVLKVAKAHKDHGEKSVLKVTEGLMGPREVKETMANRAKQERKGEKERKVHLEIEENRV